MNGAAGDWDAPKSDVSNARIGVEPCVIERINRLKLLTVEVRAGRAVRRYKIVKSDRPEDLVFQSVKTGAPMRDNNILSRHIKPAARKLGLPWINWRCLRTSMQPGWSRQAPTQKTSKARCGILASRRRWTFITVRAGVATARTS